ncbi:hypothetical protein CWT02_2488 [Salmonella enterica subsp. enterica serovar Cubana]|nr:hypothetical protein CWT02_2488 [Salmonella enterica subsp. enterica serovar Cubana]
MLCLAGFIILILKEFTVNKWRNPTRRLCAVAMPFACSCFPDAAVAIRYLTPNRSGLT